MDKLKEVWERLRLLALHTLLGLSYILGTVFQKSSFALAFDSGNSEYLDIPSTTLNNNGDKVELKGFDLPTTNNSLFILFYGTGTNGNANYVGFDSNGFLNINYSNIPPFSFGNITYDSSTKIDFSIEIINNGADIKFSYNGQERIVTKNTAPLIFDNILSPFGVYSNISINSFFLNGTNYPLTEGLGNTTNGATINTSHADGIKRINFGMWQKNGNVLKFDSANRDYLEITTPTTFNNFGEVSFDIDVYVDTTVNGDKRIFSFGDTQANGTVYLFVRDNSTIRFLYSDANGVLKINNNQSGTYQSKFYNFKLENGIYYIDGVQIADFSGFASDTINNSNLTFGASNYFSGAYVTGVYSKIEFGGKTLLLREGSGNTTTSEDGTTTATINTSHASGGTYIDEEIWQESKQKWIDYKI